MAAPIAAAEEVPSRPAWTRESADAAIADPAKRAEMEFIRKAVMQGACCAHIRPGMLPSAPPALACSPMLTRTRMLPSAPEEFHFLYVSLAVYLSPQLFAGMTQKQIAEAVHLKHFSDQRLEREARIRERWGSA